MTAQHAVSGDDSAATGAQYRLRSGTAEATVVGLAGALREYRVDGIDYVEPYPAQSIPPAGNGIQMSPWPNRVAGARWSLHEAQQQLDVTEPTRGHASHGLLRNTQFIPEAVTADRVVLRGEIHPQHGWPFRMTHRVEYALAENGDLTVCQRLLNRTDVAAPAGFGAHPFLRIGEVPSRLLRLTVEADTWIDTDESLIPIADHPVQGSRHDYRDGQSVGAEPVDVCLTDLAAHDGRHEASLEAPDGSELTLWSDEVFAYTHVFVTDRLPGREHAVAVEPLTMPANALNTGRSLRWLEAGESLLGRWGLRPRG